VVTSVTAAVSEADTPAVDAAALPKKLVSVLLRDASRATTAFEQAEVAAEVKYA
jgi:hypothetical protein